MLVGGGVVAVLAGAIGGRLKAFGTELPLVASPRRQALLAGAGVIMVAIGIWMGRPAAAPGPVAEVTGMTVVDFRSSEPEDTLVPGRNQGFLLVTTDLALRNTTEPGRSLTWTGTSGLLRIGGAAIPFRNYYFTNLTNAVTPWLGEGATAAAPASVGAGEVVRHDVMFISENNGTGLYKWDDFLRAITAQGARNPLFEITLATAVGEEDGPSIPLRCTARIDALIGDIRRRAAEGRASHWIASECIR